MQLRMVRGWRPLRRHGCRSRQRSRPPSRRRLRQRMRRHRSVIILMVQSNSASSFAFWAGRLAGSISRTRKIRFSIGSTMAFRGTARPRPVLASCELRWCPVTPAMRCRGRHQTKVGERQPSSPTEGRRRGAGGRGRSVSRASAVAGHARARGTVPALRSRADVSERILHACDAHACTSASHRRTFHGSYKKRSRRSCDETSLVRQTRRGFFGAREQATLLLTP